MNIGLIGNEPHLKAQVALLEKKGHTVVLLGGSPKNPFPRSIDLFVCRPASTSHNGFNAAMKEKRSGRDVLITNNPAQMLEYIESKEKPVARSSILPPDINKITAHGFMAYLAATLGVYGPLLHTQETYAQDLINELLNKRFSGQKDAIQALLSFWEEGLVRFQRNTIRANTRKSLPEGMGQQDLFFATHAGPKPTIIWFQNGDSLRRVLDLPFVGVSEQSVREKASKNVVVEVIPEGTTPKQYRAETVSPVASAALPGAEVAAVTRAAPVSEPTLPLTAQAPVSTPTPTPTPTPALAPAPAPAPVKSPEAWDAQLRVALGLVLAEMKAAGVHSLSINGRTGAVNFRREVVKIVVEDGGLTVSAEE